MNIAAISRNSSLYSTKRLVEAAKERGHEISVIDYVRCYLDITSSKTRVMYQGEALPYYDAIIPRIRASHRFYGTAVVRQFEMMGVFRANESHAISWSRDKLHSLQILAREGIGMPVTGFASSTDDTDGVIQLVGGARLVVKLIEGTQGVGVVLAETQNAGQSVIESFRGLEADILVQRLIKESNGKDVRFFIIGNKVLAAMERTGAPGEFRSNLHRGGSAEVTKLTSEELKTAVAACKALGLNVAGVDILSSDTGPLIMEVNSSPGLDGIEQSMGIDVAGKIREFLETHAKPGKVADRVRG
jgi:ribosomal protein S6--L-glutamate ligase